MFGQGGFGPDNRPAVRQKHYSPRSDQLLQRPTPTKPPALTEGTGALGTLGEFLVGHGRDIYQEGVADFRSSVPFEHGVDGFAQLGRAGLVDTHGVCPQPLADRFVLLSIFAGFDDLDIAFGSLYALNLVGKLGPPPSWWALVLDIEPVLEGELLISPGVGEYGVSGDLATSELFDLERLGIYQPHLEWVVEITPVDYLVITSDCRWEEQKRESGG